MRGTLINGSADVLWKWLLRIVGLGIGIYEITGEGRVYVLTLAAGMMGLPTFFSLSSSKGRE